MSFSSLTRWSGGALLVAGTLVGIATLFHPNDVAEPSAVLTNVWAVVHTVYILAFVLSLFGLVGLYARQAQRVGRLGVAGFVLVFIGSAMFLAIVVTEAAIVPAIAASEGGEALLSPSGPLFGGELGLIFLAAQLSFALGAILFGISIARAGVLPRWAGILFAIGAPLAAFWPPLPQALGVAGGVLIGAGYVWLGYALWSEAKERAAQPQDSEGKPAHA